MRRLGLAAFVAIVSAGCGSDADLDARKSASTDGQPAIALDCPAGEGAEGMSAFVDPERSDARTREAALREEVARALPTLVQLVPDQLSASDAGAGVDGFFLGPNAEAFLRLQGQVAARFTFQSGESGTWAVDSYEICSGLVSSATT